MGQRITIDPITRLEGHGKIEIFLDDKGNVSNAYMQVPELRGFEQFCVGRCAEEMPRITQRICGVCPTAHHMAATKCLDDLWKVEAPPAGKKVRELFYNLFMLEDHTLHFFYLGGPDFIVGPTAPKAERNILGVLGKVGLEVGGRVIKARREIREIMEMMGGKAIHPVLGLPGGVAKRVKPEDIDRIKAVAEEGISFAKFSLEAFNNIVLGNKEYVDLITADIYSQPTYYMGLVDEKNKVNFYDGKLRTVTPKGKEFNKFRIQDYAEHIAEHTESWSYIKFPFLRKVGWKGFVEGEDNGIYQVAPLARLNASEGMSTPLAQAEYEKMYKVLGGKPCHLTLAFHWARLIEALNAAEIVHRLANDPEILDPKVRNIPTNTPKEGMGVVEAPRGTLIHHYKSDENGILTDVNIIVATQQNEPSINMGINKVAKHFIKDGKVDDGILNLVELTYRAYDPCHGCGTHSLPGGYPLTIEIKNRDGEVIREISNRKG